MNLFDSHRRLAGVLALAAVPMAQMAGARTLDLSRPADVIVTEERLGCAPDPARPRISYMTGQLYSLRVGEPGRHLFDVQAVNTRACRIFQDPRRGPGYRSVGREIMIYLDPASGRILDTWPNPWTGETVKVIPMFNDPVNMRAPVFAFDAEGRPAAVWQGRIVNGVSVGAAAMPCSSPCPGSPTK